MKELKDIRYYLHFYIGCQVDTNIPGPYMHQHGHVKITELTPGNYAKIKRNLDLKHGYSSEGFIDYQDYYCKLILRPLESMTPKEITEYYEWPPRYEITKFSVEHYGIKIAYKYPDWITPGEWMHSESFFHFNDIRRADKFLWLLSKGFDLFGLKEAGLAVYETEIKK